MNLLGKEGRARPGAMTAQGSAVIRSAGDRGIAPGAAGLAGVAAAYYLGALVGSALRFPPATTSVLWPPNAILTAALLLVPPASFWQVVLAALPAHFAAQLPGGMPLGLSSALFVTNCAEALLAAWLVHRWSDRPDRFDSLQRVLIFLAGAVLFATFVTTFADAAAVHALRGEDFAAVFFRRLFSNMLGQLVVVPSAVVLVQGTRRWLLEASRRDHVQALLFALAHVMVGGLVLLAYHGSFDLPGGPFTALPLLMPLLVVAAVRFGPAGASLSLLATALLATCIAVWGGAGSAVGLAEERVLALQVFLIVVGAPLLCLSALVEERRSGAATLWERLRFEELLSQISSAFVHVRSREMNEAVAEALERLGRFLGLGGAVLRIGERSLAACGAERLPDAGPRRPIVWRNGRQAPASPDEWLERVEPRALLALPLSAAGEVVGELALVSGSPEAGWPAGKVEAARLVADVFASALARQRAEEALRASETMNSAVLASLSSRVAVLDRDGRIVAVNEAWTRFGRESCTNGPSGVGENYLDLLHRASSPRSQDLLEIGAGIESVLAGREPTFTGEYMTSIGDRWVQLTVVPLNRPERGAVLSYTDIHERRRAEAQANQLRDELAHCLRLSTIGELTSSIAHELNQPLAAILANAQAARRLLAGNAWRDRRDELDEILADIASEDRRAGQVIRSARLLLRKGESEPEEVEVGELVHEVLKLIANDALIREVALRRALPPVRVLARGDRVQLQQVLLNLLLNALEAMPDGPGERTIWVRTEEAPPGMARVCVADSGRGFPDGGHDVAFEPFYTTKSKGLGMGLSIARSIVEAHGGTISAAAGVQGGATVSFTLPLANGAARQPRRSAVTSGP